MESRSLNNIKGIDINMYQGNIDFGKVKASGIEIVYIKATEGVGYIDPYLSANYENAVANGLKVGFYHYFTPKNEEDTKAEAQAFYDAVKGKEAHCKYCLDIEVANGLDKNILSNLVKTFMEEIKMLTGKQVVVYTFTNFARNNITDILSIYPVWIAHYGVNTPGDNPIWNNWIGFQYSSSGIIDGISGNVDMDEFTQEIFLNNDDQAINNQFQQPEPVDKASVNYIQAALNGRYGFKLLVDNIPGPQTLKGIYSAIQIELNKQYSRGLVVDGIPGSKTLEAAVILKKGDKGSLTWLLQALLICKGFSVGKSGADGDFGAFTQIAVEKFQSGHGLTDDGIVGVNTWRKLLGL